MSSVNVIYSNGLQLVNDSVVTKVEINKVEYIVISVHLSSSACKAVKEMEEIMKVVDENDCKVILTGDFNHVIKKNKKNLILFDKEKINNIVYTTTITDRSFVVSDFNSTTGKIRALTTQFNKMFQPAFASIDAFVIFYPKGETPNLCSFKSMYSEESSNSTEFPDPSWPSDHKKIIMESWDYNDLGDVYSLNCFGESVKSGPSFNIFEMMTSNAYNKFLSNPEIKEIFDELFNQFIKSHEFFLETKDEEGNKIKNLASYDELIKNKFYAKTTRKMVVCGSVFQPPSGIDETSEFYIALMNEYQKEKDIFDQLPESQDKEVGKVVLEYYNQCVNHPTLKQFFIDWFLELEQGFKGKKTYLDVILKDLREKKPKFYCLQELSVDMIAELKEYDFESLGYRILIQNPHYDEKTGGAHIIALLR